MHIFVDLGQWLLNAFDLAGQHFQRQDTPAKLIFCHKVRDPHEVHHMCILRPPLQHLQVGPHLCLALQGAFWVKKATHESTKIICCLQTLEVAGYPGASAWLDVRSHCVTFSETPLCPRASLRAFLPLALSPCACFGSGHHASFQRPRIPCHKRILTCHKSPSLS